MSNERECRIERIRDRAGRLGNSVAYNWPIRNSEVRDCLVELYYLLGEVERLEQCNRLESAVVAAALAERQISLIPATSNVSGLIRLEAYRVHWRELTQATDALLAFRGEEVGDG